MADGSATLQDIAKAAGCGERGHTSKLSRNSDNLPASDPGKDPRVAHLPAVIRLRNKG